jgi:hypothetical protein
VQPIRWRHHGKPRKDAARAGRGDEGEGEGGPPGQVGVDPAVQWLDGQYERIVAAGERFRQGTDTSADRLLLSGTSWTPPRPPGGYAFVPEWSASGESSRTLWNSTAQRDDPDGE